MKWLAIPILTLTRQVTVKHHLPSTKRKPTVRGAAALTLAETLNPFDSDVVILLPESYVDLLLLYDKSKRLFNPTSRCIFLETA